MYPVFLMVSHAGKVRRIQTGVKIPDIKYFENGRVTGLENAEVLNKILDEVKNKALLFIKNRDFSSSDCKDIKDALHDHLRGFDQYRMGVSDLFDWRIRRFRDEGNHSYADMNEDVKKAIVREIGNYPLDDIDRALIIELHKKFEHRGYAPGGISMKMAKFKAALKDAQTEGLVQYIVFPFSGYKMQKPEIKELDVTLDEFKKIQTYESKSKRVNFARDIFLLSFYFYGMNIADLMNIDIKKGYLNFVREKTRNMKSGNKEIMLSIPQKAVPVIRRIMSDGKVVWPCKPTREDILSYVNRGLRMLRQEAGIESKLSSYSARKTFCQFAFINGVNTETIKYCIGHSYECDHNLYNGPRIMHEKAQKAMSAVLSYIS